MFRKNEVLPVEIGGWQEAVLEISNWTLLVLSPSCLETCESRWQTHAGVNTQGVLDWPPGVQAAVQCWPGPGKGLRMGFGEAVVTDGPWGV